MRKAKASVRRGSPSSSRKKQSPWPRRMRMPQIRSTSVSSRKARCYSFFRFHSRRQPRPFSTPRLLHLLPPFLLLQRLHPITQTNNLNQEHEEDAARYRGMELASFLSFFSVRQEAARHVLAVPGVCHWPRGRRRLGLLEALD